MASMLILRVFSILGGRRILNVSSTFSYNVTQFLRGQSTNCIGVQLGLGFYTDEQ